MTKEEERRQRSIVDQQEEHKHMYHAMCIPASEESYTPCAEYVVGWTVKYCLLVLRYQALRNFTSFDVCS